MGLLEFALLVSITLLLDLAAIVGLRALRTRRRPPPHQAPPAASGMPATEGHRAASSAAGGDPSQAGRRTRLALSAAGLLASLLGCGLLWSTTSPVINLTLVICGLSLLLFGLEPGLARAGKRLPQPWAGALARWLGIRPIQVLLLGLGLLLTLASRSASGDLAWATYPWYWLLWIAGIALTVAGCWIGPIRPRAAIHPLDLLAVTALAGIALAVRLPDVEYVPLILRGDEGAVGRSGIEFLQGLWDNVLVTGWYSFASLYFWIVSLSQRVLGNTATAIRVVSVLAGSGAVIATYAWARSMFGRQTAFLAAALLAMLDLHVLFSRIGLNNVFDTLTLAASMAALWAACRSGDRRATILLGLAVGFSPFFYASGRLVPVLVFLTLVYLLSRPPHRPGTAELAIVALVALSVCLPLILFWIRYPEAWSAPLTRVALGLHGPVTPALVAQQAGRTALGIVSLPMIGFYDPGAPMLMPVQALLFLGGLVLSLARWRDPRSVTLLLGLAGTIASGALSRDAPASQRLLFAAPYCAILCALPLGELGALLRRRFPARAWHASAAIIILTLGLSTLSVSRLLFWALPRHAYWDSPAEIGTLAGRHLAGLPHPLQGYFLVDEWIDHTTLGQLRYLAGEVAWVDVREPIRRQEDIPALLPPAFVMALPSRYAELEFIQQVTPGSRIVEGIGDSGTAVYRLLEILP
jgi:hypothetical protein